MHSKDFFYNNYKNHPDLVLKKLAGELDTLTPEAQSALRDVLKEKNLEDFLPKEKVTVKKDLSHLSADEIRVLINQRLERGEKPENIKIDLQKSGVNIYEMSLQESRSEENIDRRFMELQKAGKSKQEIDAALKEEFKMSDAQTAKVPERMRSNGSGLIGAGFLLLLICVPLLLVTLQQDGRHNIGYIAAGTGAGLGCLIYGIRKRMIAAKFIKESESHR
jgi:hypothetical protein